MQTEAKYLCRRSIGAARAAIGATPNFQCYTGPNFSKATLNRDDVTVNGPKFRNVGQLVIDNFTEEDGLAPVSNCYVLFLQSELLGTLFFQTPTT